MNIDNNISAFPYSNENDAPYKRGMTILDYMAGQALQGSLSGAKRVVANKELAAACYEAAAAMLEARTQYIK